MIKNTFNHKQLHINSNWKVIKNDFLDLEPDNDYPIEEVFFHFDEDILNATFENYSIDLGFYGGYLDNNRNGFFKIFVSKGNFNDGEIFEIFISRNTDKIQDKLNFYFREIPLGTLKNIRGMTYDDDYDYSTFHMYSAIEKISYRLSDRELEEIASPIQKGK